VCDADMVRLGRLRWFGHLERREKDEWVSAYRNVFVIGARGRGRNKKTWEECIKLDLKSCGMRKEKCLDRKCMDWLDFWEPSNQC